MKLLLPLILGVFLLATITVSDAFAANTIKQIVKIEGIYPADVASADFTIDPPLTDLTKTFTFVSFSTTGENDHSNTFRSYDVIDSDTLRIYGETTALGNIATEFNAYIIEYEGDVVVQYSSRVTAASEAEGEKSVTISAVTLAESFLISKGHDHDAAETTIGSEELDRVRLLTSTSWGWLTFDTPNSGPQNNLVDVVDWNDPSVAVQRGITTLAGGSSSTTITPGSVVDRTRTMLLVTYTCGTGCGTTEDPDDIMLRATLNTNAPPQIVVTRIGTEDDMQIAWTLIEFPATFVRVQYDSETMADTASTGTDIFTTPVVDFDKSIAISTVGTPFGWGGGTASSTLAGAIDRGLVHINLDDNNEIEVERGDSTGTSVVEYQVIEFLEPVFAENPQGTNTFSQVVKVEGTFTAGNLFQDFTISPALTNIGKTVIFFSMDSANLAEDGPPIYTKNYKILNPTTLRVFGSGSGSGTNLSAHFVAYLVEFDSSSPIFSQQDQVQYVENLDDTTLTMAVSTVNTAQSYLNLMGATMENDCGSPCDPTFGAEEFARLTLTGTTSWLMETDEVQNEPAFTRRIMVSDFNQNDILVQRGTGSMAGTTTTVIPSTAIDREDSILFVNFMTSSGTLGEDPADTAIRATLNISNEIVITRNSAGSAIPFAWQIITFPEDMISVIHGEQNQAGGVTSNTATISTVDLTKSLVAGTVQGFYNNAVGSGSSITVNDFDSTSGSVELEDPTTIRFIRGEGTGSWDVGYQVLSFSGGDINQGIQQQPSCCFFFINPLIDLIAGFILLINSLGTIMI